MAESKTDKMRKLFADKQVSTEQLEAVAGGTTHETADDSRFLNVLLRGHPAQPNRYGETRAGSAYESDKVAGEVKEAWKACGIKFVRRDGKNGYWDMNSGKKLEGQESAMMLAMRRMGKQLAWSDWYWS